MQFKEKIIKLIHKIYREDEYINNLIGAITIQEEKAETKINKLSAIFHFNRLDEDGCIFWEKFLNIKEIGSTLKNRQAEIRAKWLSNGHNSIYLIKNVCNSWQNGEVDVDFVDGKIKLTFNGDYGIPEDLDSLIEAINELKPAFIPFWYVFKYLLIEDIHEVKTIEEMEEITIEQFAFGNEDI